MNKLCLIAGLAIILAGCGSREILVKRSAAVPDGIDLTGRWLLTRDTADTNQRLIDAQVAAAGGRERILPSPRAERSRGPEESVVHVFLVTGSNLKITQTADGLFISFDRAIVEEYRFGEYTRVSVGPVLAERSAGWEKSAFVIETLDNEGDKLHERYELRNSGELLYRQISIWKKGSLDMSVVQVFEKQ